MRELLREKIMNAIEEPEPSQPYSTRSGRRSKAPDRLQYIAFESVLEPYDFDDWSDWSEKDLLAFKAVADPKALKASSVPDTMYYHQAMREPDRDKFQEAVLKECEDHFRLANFKLIHID